MKKILGLTLAALMVMGLVGGGTWAYFSDPETSPNNVLTAGTLDLTIGGGNDPLNILTVSAAQPGDTGGNSTTLQNAGSATGNLTIEVGSVTNTESAAGLEFTGDSINGAGVGELGGVALMAMYLDISAGGGFNGSDIGLANDGTTYSPGTLDYQTVDSYDSDSWPNVDSMTTSESYDIFIMWQIPYGGSADNTFQGDTVSVNMTFTLRSP
jgi:predicted ribosomally synthesized peptide with SipW-like signal peptide